MKIKINTKKAVSTTIMITIFLVLLAIVLAFKAFTNNIINFKNILGMP